jgi:glutamate racemase
LSSSTNTQIASTEALTPIGVFDSGIGGLSVLQALRAELPLEHFVYLDDGGFAPYGERGDAYVIARSRALTHYLRERHDIKALVIACNTATMAAVALLRSEHPGLPIVGVEPGLKPAAASSQTKHVGVIGTRGTVTSTKFNALLSSLQDQANFTVQPCDGLADAISQSVTTGDTTKVIALCKEYISAMGQFGTKTGDIDTLVLGCTHYVFVQDQLASQVGQQVQILSTGTAVARQTRRLLAEAGLLHAGPVANLTRHNAPFFGTTGNTNILAAALHRWLHLHAQVQSVTIG